MPEAILNVHILGLIAVAVAAGPDLQIQVAMLLVRMVALVVPLAGVKVEMGVILYATVDALLIVVKAIRVAMAHLALAGVVAVAVHLRDLDKEVEVVAVELQATQATQATQAIQDQQPLIIV